MANTTNLDLVKPLGTDHALISVINGNMDKVDAYAGKVNDSLAAVQDGLAIVAVGDTHAAITSGQFVYVKEHNTLPEGLYTASTNIAANGALSTSNLTADSKGGLNALSDQIGNNTIHSKTTSGITFKYVVRGNVCYCSLSGTPSTSSNILFTVPMALIGTNIVAHPWADDNGNHMRISIDANITTVTLSGHSTTSIYAASLCYPVKL